MAQRAKARALVLVFTVILAGCLGGGGLDPGNASEIFDRDRVVAGGFDETTNDTGTPSIDDPVGEGDEGESEQITDDDRANTEPNGDPLNPPPNDDSDDDHETGNSIGDEGGESGDDTGPSDAVRREVRASIEVVELNVVNASPNEEYIVLENNGDETLELGNWQLRDREDGGKVGENLLAFRFPSGFELSPGNQVTIWTGEGENSETDLYWDRNVNIWNDTSDVIILLDPNGLPVFEHAYRMDNGQGPQPIPEPSITFDGCDVVEIDGVFEWAEVGVTYFASDGSDSDTYDVRPDANDAESIILDSSDFDFAVNGYFITSVTVSGVDGEITSASNPADCRDEIRPERPSMTIEDVDGREGGSFRVQIDYENPNEAPLEVNPVVVEGSVDDRYPIDTFEPGSGSFDVLWTPDRPSERLEIEADLTSFGYSEPLRVQTGPASDYGTTEDGGPTEGGDNGDTDDDEGQVDDEDEDEDEEGGADEDGGDGDDDEGEENPDDEGDGSDENGNEVGDADDGDVDQDGQDVGENGGEPEGETFDDEAEADEAEESGDGESGDNEANDLNEGSGGDGDTAENGADEADGDGEEDREDGDEEGDDDEDDEDEEDEDEDDGDEGDGNDENGEDEGDDDGDEEDEDDEDGENEGSEDDDGENEIVEEQAVAGGEEVADEGDDEEAEGEDMRDDEDGDGNGAEAFRDEDDTSRNREGGGKDANGSGNGNEVNDESAQTDDDPGNDDSRGESNRTAGRAEEKSRENADDARGNGDSEEGTVDRGPPGRSPPVGEARNESSGPPKGAPGDGAVGHGDQNSLPESANATGSGGTTETAQTVMVGFVKDAPVTSRERTEVRVEYRYGL